jgi:Ca2+-binding EF-hand superfamily protein
MAAKKGTPSCFVCNKLAYPTEQAFVGTPPRILHKACLKCSVCGKTLSPEMAKQIGSKLYCAPHHRAAQDPAYKPKPVVDASAPPTPIAPTYSLAPPKPRAARPVSQSLKTNKSRMVAVLDPVAMPGLGGATQPLSKTIFNKYAGKKKGLSHEDFHAMCMEMGYLLSDAELELAIKKIDSDGNGAIEYEEFLQFWKTDGRFEKLRLDDTQLMQLNKAFRLFISFDKDGSGTIDREEFGQMHASLTEQRLSNKPAEVEWGNMDTDGSGTVSFNEFVDWLLQRKIAL